MTELITATARRLLGPPFTVACLICGEWMVLVASDSAVCNRCTPPTNRGPVA